MSMVRTALPMMVLALSVGACATMPPPPQGQPVTGACNAENARWAIGQGVTDEVVNRVLRDSNSRDARVIEPGQAVTMDFRGDRVNIELNERGAITGVRCG